MEKLVKVFKALGDKNRLRIVRMLQCKSLCVCEITAVLGLATPTVSRHLSVLKEANLIKDFKNGRWVDYSLNEDSLDIHLIQLLADRLQTDGQAQADIEKISTISRDQICSL